MDNKAMAAYFCILAILLSNLKLSAALMSGKTYEQAVYPGQANSSITYSFGNQQGSQQGIVRLNQYTSKFKCAAACSTTYARSQDCRSFIFVGNRTSTSPGLEAERGICEIFRGSTWTNYTWPSDPPDVVKSFYVDSSLVPVKSTFKIIPAYASGSTDPNMPWANDCMNQGGIGGFMVAIRNNVTTSNAITDFKCRMFAADGGLLLVRYPGSVLYFANFADRDMRCPANTVLTAIFDSSADLKDPDNVRCNALSPPWRVDTSACRLVYVYKGDPSTLPLSPMNDPTNIGTAESVWGAQCGSQAVLEAMVAYKLSYSPLILGNESFMCCRIIQADQ